MMAGGLLHGVGGGSSNDDDDEEEDEEEEKEQEEDVDDKDDVDVVVYCSEIWPIVFKAARMIINSCI